MATYSAELLLKTRIRKLNNPIAGIVASATTTLYQAPDGDAPILFGNGSGAGLISKFGYGYLSLLASTPVTVALDALASAMTVWEGDTAFTKIKIIEYRNLATPGTNKPVVIGAAASVPFVGPLGGTAPTFTLEAGGYEQWLNLEANGWACGTNKNLKFDPGSNAVTIALAIAGN